MASVRATQYRVPMDNEDEPWADLRAWDQPGYPPPIERIRARCRWGAEFDRVTVGRGWWPLLARLDEQIVQVDPRYALAGVHSEQGLLLFRVWSSVAPQEVVRLIRAAMIEASETCEYCARSGALGESGAGMVAVRCVIHRRVRTADESRSSASIVHLQAAQRAAVRRRVDAVLASISAAIRPSHPRQLDARSNEEIEAQWRSLAEHIEHAFDRHSEFTAAVSAYAVDHPGDLHLDEIREIRDEYGVEVDPQPEEVLSLLTRGSGHT